MLSLRRVAGTLAATCAVVAAGPLAAAGADITPAGGFPFALPSFPGVPGLSCNVNQGLFPGIVNLGPTGPLGPLGLHGPLGNSTNNLPCGWSIFDLGPGGALGQLGQSHA